MAVWFASTLGLMHRVLHSPTNWNPAATTSVVGAVEPARVSVSIAAKASGSRAATGLLALFGAHGSDDCRLYDQLAAGAAALSVPFVVLPIALPMARFHYFLGEALLRWVVLFDARGPPATR